jgi:hypothetical protein
MPTIEGTNPPITKKMNAGRLYTLPSTRFAVFNFKMAIGPQKIK